MDRVVQLSGFQLPRLVRDRTVMAVGVDLHESATDCKIRGVTDDAEGFGKIGEREHGS